MHGYIVTEVLLNYTILFAKVDDLSDRLRLGMAKMQAAIGETSAAASGRMISLEEVRHRKYFVLRIHLHIFYHNLLSVSIHGRIKENMKNVTIQDTLEMINES